MKQIRLAIDVGGTFTDVFVFDENTRSISVTKTSSTPSNPEQGILDGIEKAQIKGGDIKVFSHGTTVGTNALIERKLPKTTPGYNKRVPGCARNQAWNKTRSMGCV